MQDVCLSADHPDTDGEFEVSPADSQEDPDDLFYDAARSRVHVIGGQGFIDVFEQVAAQAGFLQPIVGAGARQIQFSLDFEF